MRTSRSSSDCSTGRRQKKALQEQLENATRARDQTERKIHEKKARDDRTEEFRQDIADIREFRKVVEQTEAAARKRKGDADTELEAMLKTARDLVAQFENYKIEE